MYENDNHKEDQWAEHGVISYKELIDGLLASSTNTKDLPEEEKQWIISAAENESLPTEKDYRIRLNEIVSGEEC